MSLETIVRKAWKPIAIGATITSLLIGYACAQPEPVNPPVINPPTQTDNYTTSEPNGTTEPIVAKPFELVGDNLTAEQYKTFYDNSLEDYLKVLDVYGIKKEDARMVIGVGEKGYAANLYYNGRHTVGVGMGFDHFTTDRRGMRHEMAHAINDSLFPTYHSWFDEGLAQVASQEDADFSGELYRKFKNDSDLWNKQKGYYGPESSNTPTHLIGRVFYSGLFGDFGLTEEKNRTAINIMHQMYLKTNQQLSKKDIEYAYETALEVSLDPLFTLIGNGVKTLYSLYPSLSKDMTKTMNEF